MNPFDLPGPAFLLFYVGCIAAGVGSLWLGRQLFEGGAPPSSSFKGIDPYLVALARGGEAEAIRVAVLSLFDRSLLSLDGILLKTVPGAPDRVRRPIERQLLELFTSEQSTQAALTHPTACTALRREAEVLGLLPGPGQATLRVILSGIVIAALVAVAFEKLHLAAERGRHNVLFLELLMLVAPVVVILFNRNKPRTACADAFLANLEGLFTSLKARARNVQLGGRTNELAMLAAIFGFEALAGDARAKARLLFPAPVRPARGGDLGFWGGSSSCGSSCGGGCGGGCGGCGS